MTAPNPEGDVVLAPREPTEAMIEAAHRATPVTFLLDGDPRNIWTSMLSAAPAALQSSADGVREKVARIIMDTARLDLTAGFPPFGSIDNPIAIADAILAALPPVSGGGLGEPFAYAWRKVGAGSWGFCRGRPSLNESYEIKALYTRQQAAPGRDLNAVGTAEREVGRAVYERVEKLIGAEEGSPEFEELHYLSHLTESVEEVGGWDGPIKRPMTPAEIIAEIRAVVASSPSEGEVVADLVATVQECQRVFADYAEMHRAKFVGEMTDAETLAIAAKVKRNADLARMCEAALARAEASRSSGENR